jgi:hypothetical protein
VGAGVVFAGVVVGRLADFALLPCAPAALPVAPVAWAGVFTPPAGLFAVEAGVVAPEAEVVAVEPGLVAPSVTVDVELPLSPQPQMSPPPARPRTSHVDSCRITFSFYHRQDRWT